MAEVQTTLAAVVLVLLEKGLITEAEIEEARERIEREK